MVDRHEADQVPSPGGWVVPEGLRGGWTWVPPIHGAQPAPERMPRWVQVWYRTPFLDRYACEWMWSHGGFLVLPPDHPFQERYGPEEYEALTGVTKGDYERRCLAFARDAFASQRPGSINRAAVALEGDGLDVVLVTRFCVAGHGDRRFASRIPLWPSPHPDDYEGSPDWSEMLPTMLEASIQDGRRLTRESDDDGVTWI